MGHQVSCHLREDLDGVSSVSKLCPNTYTLASVSTLQICGSVMHTKTYAYMLVWLYGCTHSFPSVRLQCPNSGEL